MARAARPRPRLRSRAGAVGQMFTFSFWGHLRREPANVALTFWEREALVATVFSLLWLLRPGDSGRRRPLVFLMFNAFGCAIAHLLPKLN